jgi:flagellar motor switch/type III secretory pathway protein FliN
LSSSSEPDLASPFDAIGDLLCPVAVVLGTASITVRQCLGLELQTVLRMDQAAGEDMRIDVNGVTVARGEVAIIDTSTAIRLTEFAPCAGRGRRT